MLPGASLPFLRVLAQMRVLLRVGRVHDLIGLAKLALNSFGEPLQRPQHPHALVFRPPCFDGTDHLFHKADRAEPVEIRSEPHHSFQ
jgi:hypothetical protein